MISRALARGSMLAALALSTLVPVAGAATTTDSTALRDGITVAGLQEHLTSLQAIADANNDTRAAGTRGFEASVQYAKQRLEAAGYTVTTQQFDYVAFEELSDPVFQRVSPAPKTYTSDEFATMDYSGSGDVTALVQATNDIVIPPGAAASTSNSGCDQADFNGFVAGRVALIQRGTCDFVVKAENAENAGASGVIIFNEGQPDRSDLLFGTLGAEADVDIPVIGTTFAVGEDLYNRLKSGDVTVHLKTDTLATPTTAKNVIADTATGRTDRTLVVGAHLDSVPEGAGINDNGSGSAFVIETAEQFSALGIKPRNRVRFALWGAEEAGLVGSEYYVAHLPAKELKNIAANLNFDMIASPNYGRFVYDGDGSATPTAGPNGSAVIERVFNDYFDSQHLTYAPTAFDGRSDYGPFIDNGIPAGGLFTGAEEKKSLEEYALFGGQVGVAFDHCYHSACDDITNINDTALDQMSDAAGHATLQLAMTTSAINGTTKGSAVKGLEWQGSKQVR